MSADNGILVGKVGKHWWVNYGFASQDDWGTDEFLHRGIGYPTREQALVAAHDLAEDYTVLEYGVAEI